MTRPWGRVVVTGDLVTEARMTMLSAEEIIQRLDLQPHPEGGHFRETFRDPRQVNGRAASTAIYFLLAAGDVAQDLFPARRG